MKTSATNRRIRVLIESMRDGKLVPNPEFQRRLVWTNNDKTRFLETVLNDYPFPEVYVAAGDVNLDTGVGTEMLVDGQQRLTTLNQYFSGSPEFKIGKSIESYKELSPERKKAFLEYEVVVRDLGALDIESIKEIFQRLNSTNYSLNAMETQNARFNGEFKKFGESLAGHKFFETHAVFKANDVRRMEDTRFALALTTTVMSTYFNRYSELESYLGTYNDRFSRKTALKKELVRIFEFIDSFKLDSQCRVWQKSDMFTLIVELYKAVKDDQLKLNSKTTAARLKKFYNSVDNVKPDGTEAGAAARYQRAALQASNDRGNRVIRGEIIADLIRA